MNPLSVDGVFPELETVHEGDVMRSTSGARYRVIKKTTTAISVVPYRWYHAAYDWILAKVKA